MAVPNATAPTTFGDPASSRSGGSVQITSSRSTRSTAPPPARKGSPVLERRPWPDQRPGPERRVQLVAAERDEVGPGGQRPVGRQLRRVEQRPGRRAAWAAAQIASTGGRHPVTLDAPVEREERRPGARRRAPARRRRRRTCRRGRTRPSGEWPTRAQGRRLAWCSTTVVTTTSSGSSAERYARWFIASVVLRTSTTTSPPPPPPRPPGEPVGAVARLLVGGGGAPGLVAGATVDARVPRQELGHPLPPRTRGRVWSAAQSRSRYGRSLPSTQGTRVCAPTRSASGASDCTPSPYEAAATRSVRPSSSAGRHPPRRQHDDVVGAALVRRHGVDHEVRHRVGPHGRRRPQR